MSDSDELDTAATAQDKPLIAFSYPTIGDGVTIWAKDQTDADAQAALHPLNKHA